MGGKEGDEGERGKEGEESVPSILGGVEPSDRTGEEQAYPAKEGPDVLSITVHHIWLSLNVDYDKEGDADLPNRTWHWEKSGSPTGRLSFNRGMTERAAARPSF